VRTTAHQRFSDAESTGGALVFSGTDF